MEKVMVRRSVWIASVLLALVVGFGVGSLAAPFGGVSGHGVGGGSGGKPPSIFETIDRKHGHRWQLAKYPHWETGMPCIDLLVYEPDGAPLGGGGGCDPRYPPDAPARGTAVVHGSGGQLLPVAGREVWYGGAWGTVNCQSCKVIVTWADGAKTAAAVSGKYWLAYHPLPGGENIDEEILAVNAI